MDEILATWLKTGWAEMMGRPPTQDDLLIPLPPQHALRRRLRPDAEPMRSKTYCFKRLREDLVSLGLRHRRGHDLRHTMITLAREDEVDLDILKTITHDPGRKKSSSAIHDYIRYSWPVRCREIVKMRVRSGSDAVPTGGASSGPNSDLQLPPNVGAGGGDSEWVTERTLSDARTF
jgi:integrase